jgi:G:T-mismatch repair DNA endonuclease (very short patch repair protein)
VAAKLTTEQFIKKAVEIHGDVYDYSLVEYKNCNTKVKIVCKIHGVFEQRPGDHLQGRKCFKCSGKHPLSTSEFISKAREVHGNKYDYSLVEYVGTRDKVKIVCNIHGIFEQRPGDHTNKRCGCTECCCNVKSSTREFIAKARLVHGDKYDYSLVNYKNNFTNVTIICPDHGEFYQLPNIHNSKKSGCPTCASTTQTTNGFIKKAKEIHGDKYDYSRVDYKSTHTNVAIICPDHGEFYQSPCSHTSMKTGCPRCVTHTYSKQCIGWLDSITERENIHISHALNGGEYKYNPKNKKQSADGFCKETNTVYEFHGDYWHGNPNTQRSDKINGTNYKTMGELYQATVEREEKIKSLGYNLVVMWESDWKELQKLSKIK